MADGNLLDQAKEHFEDDSRTFRDGPLLNYFRLRKWFILVSVLLIILDEGWLNFNRAATGLALDDLPASEVHRWLTLFGLYLVVHAVLLLRQLQIVYWEDVTERARSHGEARIRLAAKEVQEWEKLLSHRTGTGDDDEDQPYDPDAAKALKRAKDNLERLRASYEDARGGIRLSEIGRDIIRVIPVFGLLAWTLWHHGMWAGLFSFG